MDNQDVIARFNRGLKCALHRFPLLVAFFSLVASAFCYQIATAPYAFMRTHWHFYGLQTIALGVGAFWIFLGMALICRYCLALSQHQRPQPQKMMESLVSLAKSAGNVCLVFVISAFGIWLALGIKHYLLQVPHLGTLVSIFLAWLPFVLLLVLKVAPLVIGAFLYLLVPLVAVQKMSLYRAWVHMGCILKRQPLPALLCVISGTLPLILAAWLVSSLQKHTMVYLGSDDPSWVMSMRRLVLAFTSTFVMAPAVSILSCWGFESVQVLQKMIEAPQETARENAREYKGL